MGYISKSNHSLVAYRKLQSCQFHYGEGKTKTFVDGENKKKVRFTNLVTLLNLKHNIYYGNAR